MLAANALIEGLIDFVQWRSADRIALKERRADGTLAEALARIGPNDTGGVRSFPVRDPSTGTPMVGHVVPIRFSARDIFASSSAMFLLMPVAAPRSPPVELLMSLFDLTPAEARIARGLAAGKTVDDLAGDNGVSSWRRDVRLERVEAVVQRQKGMSPEGDDEPRRVFRRPFGLNQAAKAWTPASASSPGRETD